MHAARGSLEIQDAKMTQKSPSRHHRTTLSSYVFATKACIDNRKKMLNNNISSPCPHNMVNVGPLMADIGLGVWGTQQISTAFASCLRYCSDVALWRTTKLCTMIGRLLGWYTIYIYIHFRGLLTLAEFFHVQNSLCVQVLPCPILAALLAGVSQTTA